MISNKRIKTMSYNATTEYKIEFDFEEENLNDKPLTLADLENPIKLDDGIALSSTVSVTNSVTSSGVDSDDDDDYNSLDYLVSGWIVEGLDGSRYTIEETEAQIKLLNETLDEHSDIWTNTYCKVEAQHHLECMKKIKVNIDHLEKELRIYRSYMMSEYVTLRKKQQRSSFAVIHPEYELSIPKLTRANAVTESQEPPPFLDRQYSNTCETIWTSVNSEYNKNDFVPDLKRANAVTNSYNMM